MTNQQAEKKAMVKTVLLDLKVKINNPKSHYTKITLRNIQELLDKIYPYNKPKDGKAKHVMGLNTISSYVTMLGYSTIDYKKTTVQKTTESSQYMTNTLYYSELSLEKISDMENHISFYKMKMGFEKSFEELALRLYEDKIFGSISGRCCVMLIFENINNKEYVENKIKKLERVENKKNSVKKKKSKNNSI